MTKIIPSFIVWRYEVYFAKYFDLYGSLSFYLKEKFIRFTYRFFKTPSVIYIYANKRNVGDYISHLGVKSLFGVDGPSSFCSPVYLNQLSKQLTIYKARNPNAILAIGGGGLFQQTFTDFWLLILSSKMKFSIVGVGINKMEGRKEMPLNILNKVMNKSSFTIVRDLDSYNRLKEYADAGPVKMSICPSLNYFSETFWNSKPQSNNVLLHVVHPSDLRLAGANRELITKNLKNIADDLGLVYCEHNNMSSNHEKCLRSIQNAKIVVSSRLHGCIMSFGMGVPFLPLYCDYKMKSFTDTHAAIYGIEAQRAEDAEFLLLSIKSTLNNFSSNKKKVEEKVAQNATLGRQLSAILELGEE